MMKRKPSRLTAAFISISLAMSCRASSTSMASASTIDALPNFNPKIRAARAVAWHPWGDASTTATTAPSPHALLTPTDIGGAELEAISVMVTTDLDGARKIERRLRKLQA